MTDLPQTDEAIAPDIDHGVPAHRGDPLAEQRAMARAAAVVDRSNRGVLAVTGTDRLSWLHLLVSQHVSELGVDAGTEALVLDAHGRVEHHGVISHSSDTVWLDTEPGRVEELIGYLDAMRFWSDVQVAAADLAVLSVVGPETPRVLAAAGLPMPEGQYASVTLATAGAGLVRRMPWPGSDAADLLVPRAEREAWLSRLADAGARPAGMLAFEALRVEARRPRLGLDTDERTIPHEVGWIGSAVHLEKGCYRGQETVARVANLGRPPRRLVLLHFDAGDEELPQPGDQVFSAERAVGRVGTVVQHHELGPVGLALIKRSVEVDAELVAGTAERAAPARIDRDSMPAERATPPPGRAAQLRTGRRGPS